MQSSGVDAPDARAAPKGGVMGSGDDWRPLYEARAKGGLEALGAIRSGSRVFVSAGCGRPQTLLDELVNLGNKIADIELLHLMTMGLAPYTGAEYQNRFRHNALFIGSDVSSAVDEGRADFTPTSKYQIASLIRDGRLPIDVALVQVSQPDNNGYVSMGITVGISKVAVDCARHVIAEVNPNMPRTCGDTLVHVSKIDAFVESCIPLLEAPPRAIDPVANEIARHCSRLIEDGATIHVGYTPVAFALPHFLGARRDLGVHTDILTAPIVDLIQQGVVTNSRKSIDRGKTVTSLCYGTAKIYDFVANNSDIEFRSCDYVNNPLVIARHEGMTAVSEVLKVDLSGLVCARFVGPSFGSGFMYGASYAPRGKSIVTVPATTPDESESNIVMDLNVNQGVAMSTSRNGVHYVITEYGIARMIGKTIRERALALIHIAHPKFREGLMAAAKERNYVYSDQLLPRDAVYPDRQERWYKAADGSRFLIRPAKPTDERMVQSFLYQMDETSIRYRFHGKLETMHHNRVQHFVNVDYNGTVTLLGVIVGESGAEEVIAIGQYLLYEDIGKAEVAFITGEGHRNQGIGTHLLKVLIELGREQGIESFFAEVLRQNTGMLKVFRKGEVPVHSAYEDGYHHITLDLSTGDATKAGKPTGDEADANRAQRPGG